MFSGELEDAHEHLEALLCRMAGQDDYGEAVFRIDLGHIYAHPNWT